MGIETKKIYKINIKELDDKDKKYIVELIMEINIFEEKEKMYERKIKELKKMLEKETKMKMYYRELLHRKEKKLIEIKQNQYGGLDIKIEDREYLNMPSSKPVKMICYNGGKGYEQGECYIKFFYLWESDQEAYDECECSEEYKERDFWFDKDETMFAFLKQYLNRFEWNDK